MRFINVVSYRLAHSLTKELHHSHEKKRVYYYGFQIVVGGIVKGILMVLISIILGIFEPTFIVMLFFAPLRMAAGGYHMDDYTKCMITSFGMFFIMGFILKYTVSYWSFEALAAFSAIAFLAALFTSIKYAPADTPYKPITKSAQIKKLKILSILIVFLWAAADVILFMKGLHYYVLAGCLGMVMATFIISPAGYRFFDFVSGKSRKGNNANISS